MPAQAREFEHPERSAIVKWRGEPAGHLFELHPRLGIEGRAAILDLDFAVLQKADTPDTTIHAVRRFPASAFDLSVITTIREHVGKIDKQLVELAGADLLSIEFVRQYTGAPLEANQKSVSYRLTVGANDRTLSSDEVSSIRSRIIDGMRGFGYELRV